MIDGGGVGDTSNAIGGVQTSLGSALLALACLTLLKALDLSLYFLWVSFVVYDIIFDLLMFKK
jgi:hypothetical protein